VRPAHAGDAPSDVRVLCLNAGSSSLKAAAFVAADDRTGTAPRRVSSHHVERVDSGDGQLDALAEVVDACRRDGFEPDVVAHRLVHGGPDLLAHAVVDPTVRALLDDARPFAPLHLPVELAVVDAATVTWPDRPQVACLDTAFHRHLPPVARRLPIPAEYDAAGVHRYGFHGLSYEHLVHHLGADLGARAVLAHLGSGASLAAVRDGVGVDTTMGLTPAGGVLMGTRTGDLDPGVLVHLQRAHGLGVDEIEALVDRRSGLLGLSGTSADVRDLEAARDHGDTDAALALDAFAAAVAKQVAALSTVLGGIDTVVFTAGVGEGSASVRAEVVRRLAHLGLAIDHDANGAHAPVVSPPGAHVVVRVVPADEELAMARHAVRLGGHP
jgi:acetate kinase